MKMIIHEIEQLIMTLCDDVLELTEYELIPSLSISYCVNFLTDSIYNLNLSVKNLQCHSLVVSSHLYEKILMDLINSTNKLVKHSVHPIFDSCHSVKLLTDSIHDLTLSLKDSHSSSVTSVHPYDKH
jgi:hypothetical protein